MMHRPHSFCEANCEYWDGSCSFVPVGKHRCAFRIDQKINRMNGTLAEFRIGKTWYKADWTEKPAPPLPDINASGCCG